MEKIFKNDKLSKRERIERALNFLPVDRAPIQEQLSYNTGVISLFTGKRFEDFSFGLDDVGEVIRKTVDACFPYIPDKGADTVTDDEGFTFRNEHWMTWRIGRPFDDEAGAAGWLKRRIARMVKTGLNVHTAVQVEAAPGGNGGGFDAAKLKAEYRSYMERMQKAAGEAVIIDFSFTGFCDLFDAMGLEIFTFFSLDYPDLLQEYMEVSTTNEINRVKAVGAPDISPVVLIPEDFSTKQGPLFREDFLDKYHYPYVKRLTGTWQGLGLKVLYHSDGNYKKAIPDLLSCGVDGFYCLEPSCGMNIVELKAAWPKAVWDGGVDGVSTMEKGTPKDVRREVHDHIVKTNALKSGGMIVATSSEINPPIPPENFKAMVNAVGELYNEDFV